MGGRATQDASDKIPDFCRGEGYRWDAQMNICRVLQPERVTTSDVPYIPSFCREPGDIWDTATGCHREALVTP
jgi:hypothetical protein